MKNPIEQRVNYLINLCNEVLATRQDLTSGRDQVEWRLLHKYRAAGLSFLQQYYGNDHPYYQAFADRNGNYGSIVEGSLGILEAISDEVTEGWYRSIREIVSAELFSDFIEMANHLLDEGYKDAAAVMLGSTLEEHLRQLARDNGLETEIESSDKVIPKKADVLNADLAKHRIYGKLDQKNVTAWLGLRNDAAHGKYDNYSKEQVSLFSLALNDFMARTSK